ncbi:uncharacterized protein LOC126266510 [Aethina tumida]|uniref:uncharacterized protein LOC126266510 n=1 Tax=Aethina tumida TaxID=116153 RepID=UPI0021493374|nr:uncharacterized protein LOC126266510 [Aethina tumida]
MECSSDYYPSGYVNHDQNQPRRRSDDGCANDCTGYGAGYYTNNGNSPGRTVPDIENGPVGRIRPNGLLAKLGLPCQTNPDYDYNNCYSFYANGCYNTCQFVQFGDIEDFM